MWNDTLDYKMIKIVHIKIKICFNIIEYDTISEPAIANF